MKIDYDAEADILYLEFTEPSEDSRTVEAGDGVLLVLNRQTTAVEVMELWNLRARGLRGESVDVPLAVRLMANAGFAAS